MTQCSVQNIPNFSTMIAPLRDLTRLNIPWSWEQRHEEDFNKLHKCLSDDSVLGYFEVGLDTHLVIDAGPKGLGLVLLQCKPGGWQPVACHSCQLIDTEQRYSQIKRECLAVRWACEKCYSFLIRSRFTILTDHKPFMPILYNPLSHPPFRIENWLMYLQQFDYEAVHIPGKTSAANYLSRHSLAVTPSDEKASADAPEDIQIIIPETLEKHTDTTTKSGRSVKQPVWMKDYVIS